MDDIYYEKILNRIIKGRLRIRLGDLILFIHEPSSDIIEESFDIYEESYDKAYFAGVYVEQELVEVLVENDLWSPIDDKTADEIEKQIDEAKVEAFKNYYSKKTLFSIKRKIKAMEKRMMSHRIKRNQLDHTSCKGLANFARQSWIISKTTKLADGTPFDFKKHSVSSIMDLYAKNSIKIEDMRAVARSNSWRIMWSSCKAQGNAFGKPSGQLDKNQLSLISYSQMYDSVYESPESPKQEVVDDDDCLDGWFIVQKRKREAERRKQAADDVVSNSKIANSQEIFLVAKDEEHAKEIYDLNNPMGKSVVKQRKNQINKFAEEGGHMMHFKDLPDVQQDRLINATQSGLQATKNAAKN